MAEEAFPFASLKGHPFGPFMAEEAFPFASFEGHPFGPFTAEEAFPLASLEGSLEALADQPFLGYSSLADQPSLTEEEIPLTSLN